MPDNDSGREGPLDGPLSGIVADLRLAAAFLTRLPVPQTETLPDSPASSLAGAMRVFPVIGACIGLFSGLIYVAGDLLALGPWLSATLAVAAGVLMTGALHEDALADVADGFGGGADIEAKLRIMRDSQIGTYGTLALVLSSVARIAAIATLSDPDLVLPVLVVAGAVSRAVMPAVMYMLEPARTDGVGAGAGKPDRDVVIVAAGITVIVAFTLAEPLEAAITLAFSAAAALGMIKLATRQIGGFTGDVVGATGQISEIVFLIACVGVL